MSTKLHKAYVLCCEAKVSEWMKSEDFKPTEEFCKTEKNLWLDHMR